jgi:hypothetical protein
MTQFRLKIGRLLSTLGLLAVLSANGSAEGPEYVEVKTVPLYATLKTSLKWHATTFQLKENEKHGTYLETTDIPAKICFWHDASRKEEFCSPAQVNGHVFQEADDLSIIQIQEKRKPSNAVLFIARYRGPTVGTVKQISVWFYDEAKQRFVNALPRVLLTELSDYQFFPRFPAGPEGVFVTANRIWVGGEETLYDPHRFVVKIYRLSPEGFYALVGEYTTSRKYAYNERSDSYEVIKEELATIRKRIQK